MAVFLGGALLAPWLYWIAQTFAHSLPKLANSPFHRYVDRSFLAIALAGLWPLLKNLGLTSLPDVGLAPLPRHTGKLAPGFALGFVSLAILAGATLAAGARHFNHDLDAKKIAAKLAGAILTAIVVAVLEELLFRGALFGSLRKVFHWVLALAVSSMIYAIVHFLNPHVPEPAAITWLSGLELLPHMLQNFANGREVIPGFFNLTFVGAILALAYQRTGNLYCSIGLHSGWIFWLKTYGSLTSENPDSHTSWWGTSKLIDGWAALPVLALTLLTFLAWQSRGGTSKSQMNTDGQR
jgi:membrane protease YdiL (CAAX protease family)